MPKGLEDNAEHQRRKTMTPDERKIGARDEMAKQIHLQNQRDGKNTTYDSAFRKAQDLVNRIEREKSDRGK